MLSRISDESNMRGTLMRNDELPLPAALPGMAWNVLPVPSIDDSLALGLLPFFLSFVAGSVDVIGFLGVDGLLTAHVTGNLAILAAHIVAGGPAPLALVISVPVFIIVLAMTRLLVGGLERSQIPI